MGSGQSARKLTISNEEEVGVIKVSNAIVQRLAQRESESSSTDVRPDSPSKQSSPPPPPPSSSSAAALPSAASVPPVTDTTPVQPVYYPELTLSALQIQQHMEQELKRQDQYWHRRLHNLEDGYQKINHVLEEEYKKAISETSTSKTGQKTVDIQGAVQPCLEGSNKVLKCFQDHPKETLKCSNLVEEFSNCVWNVHYTRVIEARS